MPESGARRAAAAAALTAVVLTKAATAAAGDERQAVIDAMQSWERAVESGDYEALAGHYAEDAVYYPAGSAPVTGRDAIIARNRDRGTAGEVDITQDPDDVVVHGDWAVYSCLALVRVRPAGGGEVRERRVRVLLLMQKDAGGRWQILRDIDNAPP